MVWFCAGFVCVAPPVPRAARRVQVQRCAYPYLCSQLYQLRVYRRQQHHVDAAGQVYFERGAKRRRAWNRRCASARSPPQRRRPPRASFSSCSSQLLSVSFNQDNGCFAAGTTKGFRICACAARLPAPPRRAQSPRRLRSSLSFAIASAARAHPAAPAQTTASRSRRRSSATFRRAGWASSRCSSAATSSRSWAAA